MTLSIIAAVTRDLALGRDGDLLYPISADLRRFKELTMGHPIIMGRKTFESFPNGPLPGRRNIVVSRNPAYRPSGAEVYGSLDQAIHAAEDSADKAFVIGGGELYRQSIGRADNLLLTVIDVERPDADTFFPPISPEYWEKHDESAPMVDPRSGLSYRFVCLSRR